MKPHCFIDVSDLSYTLILWAQERRPKICPKIEKPQVWLSIKRCETPDTLQDAGWRCLKLLIWKPMHEGHFPKFLIGHECKCKKLRPPKHLTQTPFWPFWQRLWPTSMASSQNLKHSWWHVVIWVWNWNWNVCPLHRSCWSVKPRREKDPVGKMGCGEASWHDHDWFWYTR